MFSVTPSATIRTTRALDLGWHLFYSTSVLRHPSGEMPARPPCRACEAFCNSSFNLSMHMPDTMPDEDSTCAGRNRSVFVVRCEATRVLAFACNRIV